MGKATKWIRNFLLGKKDNKKRSDITLSLEYKYPNNESLPGTPKVKRKWSFRKLASKGGRHKFSMSFDSIEPSKFSEKAPPEPVSVLQNRVKASVVIRRRVEILAATKIQAAFRAYLARKALHALRGLVKLQALVRGHIVRKQTASMMKQMHALMSIQVRARFHRIQVADQTQLAVKSQSSMDSSFVHNHRKQANVNPNETRLVSKCTSDHLNLSQVKMIDVDLYSDHLAISKQGQYKEYSLTRVVDSPRLLPSYMINTESSRAKARSQSEPKQRPKSNTRQRNKQTEIKDDIMFVSLDDPVIKRSSLQCKPDGCAKTVPWFSSLISHSNYYESLPDYESNFKLY